MSERRVSLLGALLVAIGPVTMALFTPAMPEIVRAFHTTEGAVKLTLSLYFAGFAFAQLVCGPLSDGFGRKPVTFAFISVYLVASLLALLAPTIELLIAARFLQGIGAAVGIAISRAIVRDLFTSERSARIMNLIGLILGVGPAFAPTIGGLTMQIAGWHAIFVVMFAAAVVIILVVHFAMVETVERDLSRIRPARWRRPTARCSSRYFVLASLVMGGTTGAIYAQATVLPFILMDRVGLTPAQFGVGMLMQSGAFFVGSLVVRCFAPHRRLAPGAGGLVRSARRLGSASARDLAPPMPDSSVMGPVAFFAFGIAFVMPAMLTAALAPFPHIAGAASSMSGFFQMGGGLVGGTVAALIGDPVAPWRPSSRRWACSRSSAGWSGGTCREPEHPARAGAWAGMPAPSVDVRPFEVARLRVHHPEFAGRDVEPGAVQRQPFLALEDAHAGKGAQIRQRVADRDALQRGLALAAVISELPETASAAGATRLIHLPMKSPGDSGSAPGSSAARMPPQRPWPITTMFFTLRLCTANSSAADVEWYSPSGE